jgi:hypothetical protein
MWRNKLSHAMQSRLVKPVLVFFPQVKVHQPHTFLIRYEGLSKDAAGAAVVLAVCRPSPSTAQHKPATWQQDSGHRHNNSNNNNPPSTGSPAAEFLMYTERFFPGASAPPASDLQWRH